MRLIGVCLIISLLVACGGTSGGTTEPDGGGVPGEQPEERPPRAGDVDGPVFIGSATLRVMESFPVQVVLDVVGEKPTPCHEVFWTVEHDGEVIVVEMISQIPPDQVCAQVIDPFTVAVPLGSWQDETREVRLNGETVGSFES
ncbi:MAG: hypothetical protein L0Z49_07280 [Actinobacteria bacterium]|nr:hypothetical protein [Actinomycetota bacterium]